VLLDVGRPVEHRLVLGREVAEERARRHVGGGGDVVDRGVVVAPGLEQVERHVGEQPPGAFLLAFPESGFGRRHHLSVPSAALSDTT
jgi:hypothetical protein